MAAKADAAESSRAAQFHRLRRSSCGKLSNTLRPAGVSWAPLRSRNFSFFRRAGLARPPSPITIPPSERQFLSPGGLPVLPTPTTTPRLNSSRADAQDARPRPLSLLQIVNYTATN